MNTVYIIHHLLERLKMKALLILATFVMCACSQIAIPKGLEWEYDYTYYSPDTAQVIKMAPDDSAAVEFRIYYSYSGETFDSLGETQNQEQDYYLLRHEDLYRDVTIWFYATAFFEAPRVGESSPSDTIQVFFPKLNPDEVYEIKIINLGF